jgi:hypothetical protein
MWYNIVVINNGIFLLNKQTTMNEGMPPPVPPHEAAYLKALEFLKKYNNTEIARLLEGLTSEQREFLFHELGGSFEDLLGDSIDITQTQEALDMYTHNIPTKEQARLMTPGSNPQLTARKEALKRLKASIAL